MKLTLPTKPLVAALKSIGQVAKPNRTHAILGNVALIAEKKQLRLVGMDLEKRMEIALSCKPKEPGSITVNCAALLGTIAERSEPEVELSADDSRVTIRAGRHVGNRPGLPADELLQMWPESPKGAHKFAIPAELLKEALAKCLIQAGTQDGERAFLKSVFFVSRNGKLNIQATNGQRLIIFYTPVDFDAPDEQFLIPKESVPTLVNLAESGDVEFEISEQVLCASTDGARFSTKLIEAKFADFEKAFPSSDKLTTAVVAERGQFVMELKTALQYCDPETPSVSVECNEKEIIIASQSKKDSVDSGSPIDAHKGSDKIQFACNPLHLIDALNALPDAEVTLRFMDAISPFVIRNDTITTVVYPQRLA